MLILCSDSCTGTKRKDDNSSSSEEMVTDNDNWSEYVASLERKLENIIIGNVVRIIWS